MATTKVNGMKRFPENDRCKVLILGCGNSSFGQKMLQDGWGSVVNIDFSSVVIEQMKKKYEDYSDSMEFICADITKSFPFADESFDLIICKGTFDAILTSSSSVTSAKFLVSECSRVLTNGHGGRYFDSYKIYTFTHTFSLSLKHRLFCFQFCFWFLMGIPIPESSFWNTTTISLITGKK